MTDKLTTISVSKKDKKKFKDLVNKNDSNQQIFFGIMVKIMKDFDPEIKEIKIKYAKAGGKNGISRNQPI